MIIHTGKVAMMGQDTRKACVEFVETIQADPTHFGAYKCECDIMCVCMCSFVHASVHSCVCVCVHVHVCVCCVCLCVCAHVCVFYALCIYIRTHIKPLSFHQVVTVHTHTE